MNYISDQELLLKLNTQSVKRLQMIILAILLYPFVLLVVGIYMYLTSDRSMPDPEELFMVQVFSIVNGLFFVVGMISNYLKKRSIRIQMDKAVISENYLSSEELIDRIWPHVRSYILVQAIIVEGVSFLSLVVCMVGGIIGVLNIVPIYWLNGVPFLYFLYIVFKIFPKPATVVRIIKGRSVK